MKRMKTVATASMMTAIGFLLAGCFELEAKRMEVTRSNIATIAEVVETFSMTNNGKLPDTLEELKQSGLLKESVLIDGWGKPFNYSKRGRSFTIISAGPDCEFGTMDDITN